MSFSEYTPQLLIFFFDTPDFCHFINLWIYSFLVGGWSCWYFSILITGGKKRRDPHETPPDLSQLYSLRNNFKGNWFGIHGPSFFVHYWMRHYGWRGIVYSIRYKWDCADGSAVYAAAVYFRWLPSRRSLHKRSADWGVFRSGDKCVCFSGDQTVE